MQSPYLQLKSQTELVYDKHGNKVSSCFSTERTEISCRYSTYEYDNDGKILSRKDSADYEVNYEYSKPFIYRYDKKGNLTFDGAEYILDSNQNVIEVIPYDQMNFGAKRKFDNSGRKIEETETYYNRVSKKVIELSEPKHYKYDTRDFIIEIKKLRGERLTALHKFEYE